MSSPLMVPFSRLPFKFYPSSFGARYRREHPSPESEPMRNWTAIRLTRRWMRMAGKRCGFWIWKSEKSHDSLLVRQFVSPQMSNADRYCPIADATEDSEHSNATEFVFIASVLCITIAQYAPVKLTSPVIGIIASLFSRPSSLCALWKAPS